MESWMPPRELPRARLLTAAGYAQLRIAQSTKSARAALITRLLLALVGLAFGYVTAAQSSAVSYASALAAFLAGFGAVHFPAAVILFVKRARGEGRS